MEWILNIQWEQICAKFKVCLSLSMDLKSQQKGWAWIIWNKKEIKCFFCAWQWEQWQVIDQWHTHTDTHTHTHTPFCTVIIHKDNLYLRDYTKLLLYCLRLRPCRLTGWVVFAHLYWIIIWFSVVTLVT